MRIAAFGDINIDVVLNVDRIPMLGEEVFSTRRTELLGGSAVNTSVVLSRFGHEVAVMGAVGDDEAGDRALSMLQNAGVGIDLAARSARWPTAMNTVLVTPDGERTMIGARAANISYVPMPGWQQGVEWLHISGYALMEEPQRGSARHCLDLAWRSDIPTSLDVPTGVGDAIASIIGEYLGEFALVVGSLGSLGEVAGSPDPERDLLDAGVTRVAVTSGADPFLLVTARERVTVTPPRVESIDATGAGDALVAGVISASLAGLGLGPSATIAAAAGAAATLVPGASTTLADPKAWEDVLDGTLWADGDSGWLESARGHLDVRPSADSPLHPQGTAD